MNQQVAVHKSIGVNPFIPFSLKIIWEEPWRENPNSFTSVSPSSFNLVHIDRDLIYLTKAFPHLRYDHLQTYGAFSLSLSRSSPALSLPIQCILPTSKALSDATRRPLSAFVACSCSFSSWNFTQNAVLNSPQIWSLTHIFRLYIYF